MNQGFVICTHRKTRAFLHDCLRSFVSTEGDSVHQRYPVYVVVTGGDEDYANELRGHWWNVIVTPDLWEVGALKAAFEQTTLEEMFFLQDTFEVLRPHELAQIAFEQNRGCACPLNGAFQMYTGKYRRSGLSRVTWPVVVTKADAVRNEGEFTRHYTDREPAERRVLFPNFRDSTNFQHKHGRLNMVTENAYLRKWKGTWQDNLNERLQEIAQGEI